MRFLLASSSSGVRFDTGELACRYLAFSAQLLARNPMPRSMPESLQVELHHSGSDYVGILNFKLRFDFSQILLYPAV
jgi:hypothetical protein